MVKGHFHLKNLNIYTAVNGFLKIRILGIQYLSCFTGQLNFADVVRVNGSIVTRGTVDGVDVKFLCSDVMTITTDQTISGKLWWAWYVEGAIL